MNQRGSLSCPSITRQTASKRLLISNNVFANCLRINPNFLRINPSPSRNALVVETWRRLAGPGGAAPRADGAQRKTLVFAVDRKHAEALAQAFKDAGAVLRGGFEAFGAGLVELSACCVLALCSIGAHTALETCTRFVALGHTLR